MEAIFSKASCDECGYHHATSNVSKDKSASFFLCERCGYQKNRSNEVVEEHNGWGSYSFVTEKGIVAGGAYMDASFFGKLETLSKAITGAALFYTLKRDDKYYLINYETKQEWEFGVDDVICLEGLRKPFSGGGNNMKVSFKKK